MRGGGGGSGGSKRRSSKRTRRAAGGLGGPPDWYKDAVVYELRVRSFYDSDGDGLGDFAGLTAKLDYLADLGVTALWLLPFYPSPLRDDGYDISGYTDVHRELGSLSDFRAFLKAAHRRGLRVITELVLNHTSDQHPWFQRARRAAPGSAARSFYVWSDTPERYKDARIIFQDFEPSNWSWDPVAKAYYWHRFYAHQPDLNFESTAVRKALLSVLDFWFGLGVDGVRLDAVPYLYEEEGTSCENLPQTHAFLRELRAHVDARWPNRMLLAEANQWPEDAVAYFGRGDECHMAFHFPIMPRLFMSVVVEDRFPIVDILAQTPSIPDNCQWALFLRNHDELTLEMVTDEERDAMVRAYAHEPAMRINLGIRRRLAPLCGGDRRKMELMNAMLLSLPGTPVLYYGDEIGMGDNVYLGDRNGVRTPMQWSADKNAGFSRANPQRLVLPVVVDPAHHYEAVNVEAEQQSPGSLLWWTKRIVATRKRYPAFGRGSIEMLGPANPRVLAFVREISRERSERRGDAGGEAEDQNADERVLCVFNLSRLVQFTELDLGRWRGLVPVEVGGRTRFPPIGDHPYPLTLGEYGYYWLALEPPRGAEVEARSVAWYPATFEGDAPFAGAASLGDRLAAWLRTRSWVDPAALRDVTVVASTWLAPWLELAVVAARDDKGDRSLFAVPLAEIAGPRAESVRARAPHAILAERPDRGTIVVDALVDPTANLTLARAALRKGRLRGKGDELFAAPLADERVLANIEPVDVHAADGDPARARTTLGTVATLDITRRLDEGTSPDVELRRALAQRDGVPVPRLLGVVELRSPGAAEPTTIGCVESKVASEATAWDHARAQLRRTLEQALAVQDASSSLAGPPSAPWRRLDERVPMEVQEQLGGFLDQAEMLGSRVAALHASLAPIGAEATSMMDQRSYYQSLRNLAARALRAIRAAKTSLSGEPLEWAEEVLAADARLVARLDSLLEPGARPQRIRCHGDLSLSNVLWTGHDFVIDGLRGDPAATLRERRRTRAVTTDVGALLESLHRAAFSSLLNPSIVRPEDRAFAGPWAQRWYEWTGANLLRGYLDATKGAPFVPEDRRVLASLLDTTVLGRTLADVAQSLNTSAPGREIPLLRLARLLAT